jgi:hypothetical protein
VAGRDRGLQLPAAGLPHRRRLREHRLRRRDRVAIPHPPILAPQQDDIAVCVEAGRRPRVLKREEGCQTPRLGLLGQARRDHAGKPHGVGAEIAVVRDPGRRDVRLVVHQGDDGQDVVEPARQLFLGGHVERDPGGDDLPLRPDDPLREGWLAHQECAGDLRGRQSGHCSQGEREPGLRRERRPGLGHRDGGVHVGNVDDGEAADDFFDLRERTVDNDDLAGLRRLDRRGGVDVVQLSAAVDDASGLGVLAEPLVDLAVDLLRALRVDACTQVGARREHQDVLHGHPSWGCRARPRGGRP